MLVQKQEKVKEHTRSKEAPLDAKWLLDAHKVPALEVEGYVGSA